MFHEIEDLMKKNNSDINVVNDDKNGSTGNNRLSRWHHNSSRIIRVSRASGGKDRHSKVWTSKGPRDRRVRLSVSTALQFYDLQDRLGYDQPSKAIEWLIKAAEDSISELPILNTTFPNDQETPQNQNQTTIATTNTTNSMSKSGCSSNSDTSKNSSGLSLSRSELRDKARERARERTAKEKHDDHHDHHQDNHHHDHHHHTSFTELLTAGRQWIPTSSHHPPMEYLIGQNHFPIQTFMSDDDDHHHHDHQARFLSKEDVDNIRAGTDDHHDQHQELSFVPDHLISPGGGEGGGGGGGFNLDFNISTSSSSGVAANSSGGFSGYNRGTLQSNSTNHQSFITNLQRYNTSSENGNGNGNGNGGGGGAQFLFGALPVDNHNQHHHQFQIYYENGCRNSDQKGKGKN